MLNVYDRVAGFYQALGDKYVWGVSQELVESFLRQQAWRGRISSELQRIWDYLGCMLTFFERSEIDALYFTTDDYAALIYYMEDKCPGFTIDEDNVNKTWEIILGFLSFRRSRDNIDYVTAAEKAKEGFWKNGVFSMPERIDWSGENEFSQLIEEAEELGDMDQLNNAINDIMQEIYEYFQQPEFFGDVNTAMAMFSGYDREKAELIAENGGGDDLMRFFDYFFSDYHLINTDETPLRHFYRRNSDYSTPLDCAIIHHMLKANFHLFYIASQYEGLYVCHDLLTDEEMTVPMNIEATGNAEQMVFCGHICTDGLLMGNYTSVVIVSKGQRRRIKDEVLRLYEMYKLQRPQADIKQFYQRHAMSIKYVTEVIAKGSIKAVPLKNMPKIIECSKDMSEFQNAQKRLQDMGRKAGLPMNSVGIMLNMYEDYLNVSATSDYSMRTANCLMALMLQFIECNGLLNGVIEEQLLACVPGLNSEKVLQHKSEIRTSLDCRSYDPRYMTDGGMIRMLYDYQVKGGVVL